jgi:hypothetical protein
MGHRDRPFARALAALLLGAAACGSTGAGTHVEVDSQAQGIASVSCGDHTIDGRPRILVRLQSGEQVEVRADGVVWYRSKVEGTPSADGGVSGFDAARGADFDVHLAGHHLAGTVRCP